MPWYPGHQYHTKGTPLVFWDVTSIRQSGGMVPHWQSLIGILVPPIAIPTKACEHKGETSQEPRTPKKKHKEHHWATKPLLAERRDVGSERSIDGVCS